MLRSPTDMAANADAPPVPRPASSDPRVEELLRDLGPRLRRGGRPREPLSHLPTGIADIDGLLGGGFPRGRLSEIAGPTSSGRTSLSLALLARTTAAGEVVAVVDGADAFDPASAEDAGVRLERVLWARPPRCAEALRGAERLLSAHGFALVLLDLAAADPRLAIPPAAAVRLARAAASTGTALVVVSRKRVMGTAAEVALELAAARSHFTGTPPLLEGLVVQAALVRRAAVPGRRCASVRLRSRAA